MVTASVCGIQGCAILAVEVLASKAISPNAKRKPLIDASSPLHLRICRAAKPERMILGHRMREAAMMSEPSGFA